MKKEMQDNEWCLGLNLLEIAELHEREAKYANKLQHSQNERAAIATFIDSVPDVQARRILRLRYMDGLPWLACAMRTGYSSEGGARWVVNKFVQGA